MLSRAVESAVRRPTLSPCLALEHSIITNQTNNTILEYLHSLPWLTEAVEEDEDAVMELPVAVQAEAAPSHPLVEEATVAVVDTAAAATAEAEIAEAEIAVATVEVVIVAEVAVTEVAEVAAVADGHLRRSTRLALE